ncbi:16S rRNA (guanine(966)-N(2))-methyltransferase RsmD [Lactobacillus helveticus]|jgi:16S rRNA (guanine966-N2)-methyltransferase|uniref:Possible rRNA (Guanine-N(2)-)-methyltransferase n=1 Tax=Lactobacillus helveticus CIRM-BIA 953 TaxID=1226335 RepID=U4QM85_LACHE|nr:16S rRNA (guanine(966)-N(2))-methyltransferase RsmD [Lactobacillus helveticus]ADX70466.1 RNA methyltransferase, RsmD family [Lactobacillus helveticus H10]NRN71523.1 Ribosomal RNA small subunit methyltransferase D [Lactobacillus helveticus]NRN73714.1 Ribosomal RNA small subunit methyltransferase D [Lactobacillus helveticus]NRN80352.1 Ribosomal RNA small subunit methyltransferase D [Lactobacillus helveticus]NRN82115.1 Ribosomal RNA small subunit methyltransferase D [Lactobacillus helveticus]
MRIISGKYAKRNLFTLKSNKTRPTSDKVKESLFNSLGQFFNGGNVLDLYAGSGALGIEAVSRGYDHASLVDINHAACSIIKKNVALTKEENLFSVYNMRSNTALKLFAENQEKFDLVFLDPPYAKEKIAKDMLQMNKLGLLNSSATIVAETDDHTELGDISGFSLIKEYHLGKTIVRIYRKD